MFFSKYSKMLSGNNNSHCIKRIHVNNLPHITIDDKFNKCMIPKTDADRTMSYSVHTTLLHQTPNTEIKYYIYIVPLHSYSESQYPTSVSVLRKADTVIKVQHTDFFLRSICKNIINPPKTMIFILYCIFNTIRY